MATIHIDGKTYEVDGANNLLEACLSLGMDVPYFCWHPALGSIGACRQCAVKQYADENDKRGRLVMSCMTPSSDKTFISIDDEEAKAFRKSVVEWLMTNHPHDCPVCAEGGHCHLQDMTVMTGHSTRKYRFNKRTHANQNLGSFIRHEMNRCIACYRCVRYYKDYAGGTDLGVFGAHDNVYFGRAQEGVLESEFSGNLTEVCPTGVFTDKTAGEHYTRKWDMQFAPSICQGCSVGCNISPGERYGLIRRIENRYHGTVNHHFLCDRGRFGYGFVNREDRPKQSWLVRQGQRDMVGVDAALDAVAGWLRGNDKVAGIGSTRASLESNFALQRLVGIDYYSHGMTQATHELVQLARASQQIKGIHVPTLRDMESADVALVLGEDVTQTSPRVALALRQTAKTRALQLAAERKVPAWNAEPIKNIAQHERSPIFLTHVQATRLDDVAADCYWAHPEEQALLGFAVAHLLDHAAPAVPGLAAEVQAKAVVIADALRSSTHPLVISGISAGSSTLVQAATQVALALLKIGKPVALAQVLPDVNTAGVGMLGGLALEHTLESIETGDVDTLIVLEHDLYRSLPKDKVDAALARLKHLIVIDHQQHETLAKADAVLAAASFAEADGTVVSMEGRAQRYFKVYEPSYYKPEICQRESWRWLHALESVRQGTAINWSQLDEATAELAAAYEPLAAIQQAAPNARYRILGLKVAREPRRYSGRTAMRANISVHEPRQPQDSDTALTFSMEGYVGPQEDSALIPFAWAPGWNSPAAWNKFQEEVGGHLQHGDPGVRLWAQSNEPAYVALPSARVQPAKGKFALVALHHIFGSDELSSRAEVLQGRQSLPYVMAPRKQVQAAEGSQVQLKIGTVTWTLELRLSDSLASGCLGLPYGLLPAVEGGEAELASGGLE
ncbi:MAG: NADH-quinone oxidoreductase subunit NuoG [Pseudomonadales bacterium]|nr:NADH-quinone oxidoreductase subunit NuoG [Pseudomonadales bacterium]